MRGKTKLISFFDLYGVQPWMLSISSDKEVIILKDKKKKFKPYKDTAFTRTARKQLQHINRHLEAAAIDLDLNDDEMTYLLSKMRKIESEDIDDDPKHLSMFTNKTLRRVFSNSSFRLHGRFYGGWWQNISEREKQIIDGKEVKVPVRYRENITINGDNTVELDYSSFHPKMLHDLAGIEMTDDPYVGIGDLDRDQGKSIFNIMINSVGEDKAASRDIAIGAFMKKYRDERMTKEGANEAIEAVLERHPRLKKCFFSGKGLKLMFYDSQIANNVMLRAIDEFQTVVLPVHDSFICIMEFEEELRQLMEEEYIEVMKTKVPAGIDLEHSDYYVTDEEKSYEEEYGALYDSDIPLDPKQKLRQAALEKQAGETRKKYRIKFEDAFKPESVSDKYSPQNEDDVICTNSDST
jgi:hypothetical protein